MDTLLTQSKQIIDEAIARYNPYAVVAMVSGGSDSLTMLEATRVLGVKVDFIMHGITGTGIRSTTEHVRKIVQGYDATYIEADAGDAYEKYVLRKGFFGIGHGAHSIAYHRLKQEHFEHALSKHIRKGKRGRRILLLSGARKQESQNRRNKLIQGPINPAGKKSPRDKNIWVDLVDDWAKRDCHDFIREQRLEQCPASKLCHRSGECLCGTMQSKDQAEEIAFWFPDWSAWWQDIRSKVKGRGFGWDWGEDVTPEFKARHKRKVAIENGQLDFFDDWLPMCQSCVQPDGQTAEGID